jgi:hypothetical protein
LGDEAGRAHACKLGLEGIVSKRRHSRYPLGALAELLCALSVQSLPAAEPHGVGADDASNVWRARRWLPCRQ